MIANQARGEVALQIGDDTFILCLTMGALARLETLFGVRSFTQLAHHVPKMGAAQMLDMLACLICAPRALTAAELANLPLQPSHAMAAISAALVAAMPPMPDMIADIVDGPH